MSAQASMCSAEKTKQAIALPQILTGSRLTVLSATGRIEARLQAMGLSLAEERRRAFLLRMLFESCPFPASPAIGHVLPSARRGQLVHCMGVQHAAPSRCCFRLALWRNPSPVGQFGLTRSSLYPSLRHAPTALIAANMGFGRSSSLAHVRWNRHPDCPAGAELRWGVVP